MTEKMEMELSVLSVIKKYNVLTYNQVIGFFPGEEKAAGRALAALKNKRRVFIDDFIVALTGEGYSNYDTGTMSAIWVLLDFMKHRLVQDHFLAQKEEFPVRIVFISNSEMYDILYIGQEDIKIVNGIFSRRADSGCKHIVIVTEPDLLLDIELSEITLCCMVNGEGRVNYYEQN